MIAALAVGLLAPAAVAAQTPGTTVRPTGTLIEPQRYDPAEEDPWINAVLIRCGPGRRAEAIEPVLRPLAE